MGLTGIIALTLRDKQQHLSLHAMAGLSAWIKAAGLTALVLPELLGGSAEEGERECIGQ
jgi:hypothetical protein